MASGTRSPLGLDASLGRDSLGSADDDDLGGLGLSSPGGIARALGAAGIATDCIATMLLGNYPVGRLRVHPKGLQHVHPPGQDCCRLV